MLTPQASYTQASVVLVLELKQHWAQAQVPYYPEQWNVGAWRGQAWERLLANGKMELWTPPRLAPPGWGRASSSSSAVMYVSSEL